MFLIAIDPRQSSKLPFEARSLKFLKYYLLISLLCFCFGSSGKSELWVLTPEGGDFDSGPIFKTDSECDNYQVEFSFDAGDGALIEINTASLRITEIMYNPPESGADSLEFIEIFNAGTASVDLSGFSISSAINHVFNTTLLAPNAYLVVAKDSIAMYSQFGVSVIEWDSGTLVNGGEDIVLKDNLGQTLDSVEYDNTGVWPGAADGDGPSIVLCDLTVDQNDGSNWLASLSSTGKIINGFALMGSPNSQDAACSSCGKADSTFVTQVTCDTSQAGVMTLTLTGSDGCDSLHTTTTGFDPGSTTTLPAIEICAGDQALVLGNIQTEGGIYYDTLQNSSGCDSVVSQQLIVNPTYHTVLASISICQGGSTTIFGVSQTTAGIYYDTLVTVAGCDSVLSVELIVDSEINTSASITICEGDSVLIFGVYRSQAATYSDTSVSSEGCDSIHSITLNVLPASQGFTDVSICDGESIMVGGALQGTAGVYIDTLTAGNGCDSIVYTTLRLKPVYTVSVADSICNGDSLFVGGAYQTTPGVYQHVFIAGNGCDSTVTTTLTLKTQGCHVDCNGDINGNAFIDSCGTCVGGNTGLTPCSPGCINLEVVSLSLIDATTGLEIRVLMDGDTIDKSAGPFSVRAHTCSGTVGSVMFSVNGSLTQTENLAPYDINGGTLVKPFPWNPVAGPYRIAATPYSGLNGRGTTGIAEMVNIEIVDSTFTSDCNGVPGGSAFVDSCGVCVGGNTGRIACIPPCMELEVTSFMLISASTGNPIGLLQDGDVIDKSLIGPFSIRANVCNGPVGSVLFDLNGTVVMKENLMPYDINGGSISRPNAFDPAPGFYTLVGEPYSNANGNGTLGVTETVTFTVTQGGVPLIAGGNSTTAIEGANMATGGNSVSANEQTLGDAAVNQASIATIKVYPNPTQATLYIEAENLHGKTSLVLMDNAGRTLQRITKNEKTGIGRVWYELDMTGLPKGVYLIQLSSGNEVFHRRVVKN